MRHWDSLSATAKDAAVALFAFAVGAVLYVSGLYPMTGPSATPLAARFGLLALLCAASLLRRRAPLMALVLGIVPVAIDFALGPTVPVWLVYSDLIYAACLYGSRRLARAVAIGCAAVSAALALVVLVVTGSWQAAAVVVAAAAVFAGMSVWWALAVRHHKELAAAERTRAQALTLVADLDRRAAIADERRTMARDLHDVIAGHLSAIALQSEAALGVLARTDPDAAVTGILGSIRANSVSALQEMRTMIGLLRDDGGADGAAAPRGLAQLPLLADAARAAGTVVRVRDSRAEVTLPSAVDQAAYRILQEALTNAMKHAPGRDVDITVAAGPDAVDLAVRNRLPPTPGGGESGHAPRGLLNMHERAAALGGSFRAGTDSADWVVTARLPIRDTPEVV
ncbi:sensor histidine kinase [Nocardia blacklockiae]|uniref:sensor histidine kinase n=1 Tax=Nocardia blacklockiae TaxID=480036 RepID=UPI001893B007|nr:histidine kinase [Nocardia blacklockiae]MBF6170232.1 two-component sensor histidine kinase [Nocardia blacklockiae]